MNNETISPVQLAMILARILRLTCVSDARKSQAEVHVRDLPTELWTHDICKIDRIISQPTLPLALVIRV